MCIRDSSDSEDFSCESSQSSSEEDNDIEERGNDVVSDSDGDNACNITDNIQPAIKRQKTENY